MPARLVRRAGHDLPRTGGGGVTGLRPAGRADGVLPVPIAAESVHPEALPQHSHEGRVVLTLSEARQLGIHRG